MEFFTNNMDLSDRYNYLMDSYNTLRTKGVVRTWSDFAIKLGVNRTCLSAAKNQDSKYLTDSLISKIQGVMKQYKTSKLVSGYGEQEENLSMLNDKREPSSISSMRFVPTIPIHAYRATNFDVMEYFRNTEDDVKMSPIVMQFPGTDCYYFVNSEDMSPNLRTNDLLCLAKLPDEAKVTNGDICILNTKYQGMLERFVYDDGDYLLLKSTQPRWTDMRIPKDEIFNIFRILGGIRTNI